MAKYKLGDIAPIQQGSVPESESYWLLNLDMVESNTGHIYERLYVPFDKIRTSTIAFDTNNVLYSKLRPYLNKVVIPDCPGYATSEMLPLKPNKNYITREYLTYFLRSPKFVAYINEKTSGAKMPRANSSDLKSVEIECPTLENQRHITSEFDRIISIVRLRQQQLQKLDELVKSRFVELFGDMILNPNSWEKVDLGTVCDVRDGTHDSPKYFAEGIPLVTSRNLSSGRIDFTDCNLICEADYNKINERSKVDLGDILMPMIGTVGNPIIVDIDAEFAIKNVALIKFSENSKVVNVFVKALLESDYFDRAVLDKVRGGTQKFISLGDIRRLKVCLPPLEVQKQFAAFVTQADKSKVAVQKALDEAQLLFDSLMQKYFG